MKRFLLIVIILFFSYTITAQVGINNTDPKASLDITATNAGSPSNTDGILIPRIDTFPSSDPTADQQGMMVYLTTTSGGNPPGFYFWDNNAGPAAWVSVVGNSIEKIDDLSDGKSDDDGTDNGSSIFLGINAGENDDSSNNANIGIGKGTLGTNTSGSLNVGVGFQSMLFNTSGTNNTALGYQSLLDNTTGDFNTAIGTYALYNNTTAQSNTSVGHSSLMQNITGQYNIAVGNNSLQSNTIGSSNLAIGFGAGYNSTGNNNLFLGYNAGYNETGSYKLYIENSNANADNALIYGEFNNNILRTNGELQIGNPTGTGYAFPTTDGTSGQTLTTDGSGQLSFTTTSNDDHDWYEVGTTDPPNNIYDNKFTQGNVGIGHDTPLDVPLYVYNNSNINLASAGIVLNRYHSNTTTSGNGGINAFTDLQAGSTGWYYNIGSSLQSQVDVGGSMFNYRAVNNVRSGSSQSSHYLYYGIFSNNLGSNVNAKRYGSYIGYTTNTTSTGDKYGHYTTIPSTVPGTHYGMYSDVTSTSGYAGYFLGRTSFGTGTSNRYLMPETDGTVGQVITTNGAGQLAFSTIADDNDWTIVGSDIERQSGDTYIGDINTTDNDLYISDRIIDWDNTFYYLDPDNISRVDEIQFDNGSVSDPSIRFSSTDTGFFSPSNGTVAYSAYGTEAFRIQTNGKITFGTTTSSTYDIYMKNSFNTKLLSLGANNTDTNPLINASIAGDLSTNIITANVLSANRNFSHSAIKTTSVIGDVYTSFSENVGSTIYGIRSIIDEDNTTGNKYGIYADATVLNSYAGYFLGKVSIGTTAANNYILPSSRGTNGQIMQTDGSGNLSWVTPTTGDITGVTAGDGLTGGGTSGNVTLNVVATNGITDTANNIKLGGSLIEDTSITYGTFDTRFNLNGTGDFIIQDGGIGTFAVLDNGTTTFGNDTYWRDTNISGTILAGLSDFSDDGVFDIYQGGSIINRIHGNGSSYINAGSLGIGTTSPDDKLSVVGAISSAFETTETNKLTFGHGGSNAYINVIGAGRLDFRHEGVTGLSFTDQGSVGIGTTAISNASLHINKNSTGANPQINLEESQADDGARINFTNNVESTNLWTLYGRSDNTSDSNIFNIYNTVGGNILHIRGDGRVGINDSAPSYALELPNNATITVGQARANAWVTYSDSRIKKEQQKIEYGLEDLLKIQPKSYIQYDSEFKNNSLSLKPNTGHKEIGFIAQDLFKIIPEAAFKPTNENKDLWSVNYEKIIPVTVQAIKELNDKVKNLENENQQLKETLSKYEALEKRLSILENNSNKNIDLANH